MTEYTLIQNHIITSNLSNGAFRVLSFFTSMCFGEKVECYPSQAYIAEKLHRSVKTIQRNINELVKAGCYLQKRRRGSISNVYTILCKVVSQKTEGIIKDMRKKYNNSNKYAKKEDTWNHTGSERLYDFDKLEKGLLGYDKVKDLDGRLYDQVCII